MEIEKEVKKVRFAPGPVSVRQRNALGSCAERAAAAGGEKFYPDGIAFGFFFNKTRFTATCNGNIQTTTLPWWVVHKSNALLLSPALQQICSKAGNQTKCFNTVEVGVSERKTQTN